MKNTAVFLFLFLLCPAVHAQRNFVIDGKVSGVKDGAVLNLSVRAGMMRYSVASDTLKNGRFRFVYPLDSIRRFSIDGIGAEYFGTDFATGPDIWGDAGMTITVIGKNPQIRTWQVESNQPEQLFYNKLTDASRKEYDRVWLLDTCIEQAGKQRDGADSVTRARLHLRIDSLYGQQDSIARIIELHTLDILEQTPVSALWMEKLTELAKFYGEDSEFRNRIVALYNNLPDAWKNTPEASDIGVLLYPPTTVGVGDRMADAELRVYGGGTRKLSDFAGHYLLLDFWASGCGACYAAMPELRDMTEKYNDILTIIGINLDTSDESWKFSVDRFGPLTWVNLNAPHGSDIAFRYGIHAYPTLFLISPEGKILETWSEYYHGEIEDLLRKYGAIPAE